MCKVALSRLPPTCIATTPLTLPFSGLSFNTQPSPRSSLYLGLSPLTRSNQTDKQQPVPGRDTSKSPYVYDAEGLPIIPYYSILFIIPSAFLSALSLPCPSALSNPTSSTCPFCLDVVNPHSIPVSRLMSFLKLGKSFSLIPSFMSTEASAPGCRLHTLSSFHRCLCVSTAPHRGLPRRIRSETTPTT